MLVKHSIFSRFQRSRDNLNQIKNNSIKGNSSLTRGGRIMPDYENEARQFIKQLDPETRKKAIIAIQDILKDDKDWKWIATALKKKGIEEWQKWGFGLFFNFKFQGSVYQQIERDERSKTIDASDWLNGGSFDAVDDSSKQSIKPAKELLTDSPFSVSCAGKPAHRQSAKADGYDANGDFLF